MTAGYLNTRGRERHRDYQFLGPAPPTTWWRAYADHTTFERPTVLVQSDGRSWQVYLSGIPSRRRDAVGTTIRYTVVAESGPGAAGAAEPATGDMLALVANWLADQDLDRGVGRVSAALDGAFPEPEVERLLAADLDTDPDRSDRVAAEVAGRLVTALHELRPPGSDEPEPAPDGWLADLSRPAARAVFVARVDALLAGQPGRALVLNLVGTPADLRGLLDDPRPLAVLAPDLPEPAVVVALDREPTKKAAPPPGTSPPESAVTPASPPRPAANLRGCLRLILVPIALLMALALALLGTLFYLR